MQGFKPNAKIWERVNVAILDENMGVVLITIQSGLCNLLIANDLAKDETEARVRLAAMLLSPDASPVPGSLVPLLKAELELLNDGKWMQ